MSGSGFLRELKPQRERITVQLRKMMMTIVWNHTGPDRIVALPKGMKFNPDDYISYILDRFTEWRRSRVGPSDRRLPVHKDNVRPHTAKKIAELFAGNVIKRDPHPPYSPDLAPWDFYLLGTSKADSQVHHSRSPINSWRRLMRFFSPLKKPHRNACFRSGWTDWRNVVW
jgi:hypothetical protein